MAVRKENNSSKQEERVSRYNDHNEFNPNSAFGLRSKSYDRVQNGSRLENHSNHEHSQDRPQVSRAHDIISGT